jgi:hypothetical protein
MADELVSLKEHVLALIDLHERSTAQRFDDRDIRFQQRFEAQTQAINAALLSTKEAVVKAETATERRFENVNEFRQTLSDQATQFVTRTEFDAVRVAGEERIRDLTTRLDKAEGKSGGYNAFYGWMIAGAGLIVSVIIVMNVLFGK